MMISLAKRGESNYPAMVNAIQAINDEAELIMISYFSPYGNSLTVNGKTYELSTYIKELIQDITQITAKDTLLYGTNAQDHIIADITQKIEEDYSYPLIYLVVGTCVQAGVEEFNSWLKDYSAENGFTYVDIFNIPNETDLDPHPNTEGHQYIADQVFDAIKCSVNTTVTGDGVATVDAPAEAILGQKATVSASTDSNNAINQVTVNNQDVSLNNGQYTFKVIGDTEIRIAVENLQKKVTLDYDDSQVSVAGQMTVMKGEQAVYTITPEKWYEIDSVMVNGKEVEVNNNKVFLTINEDTDITVVMKSTFPFTDVPASKWYRPYVEEVYELGIMTGTTKTTFSPSDNITRGQLATILYRMAGQPSVESTESFDDVAGNKFYSKAVAWCKETGVVTGYSDGTFRPSQSITRQELALMLMRYADYYEQKGKVDPDVLESFQDAGEVSGWAKEGMAWAVENKLISGDQGKLNSKGTATRGQTAKMILAVNDLLGQ